MGFQDLYFGKHTGDSVDHRYGGCGGGGGVRRQDQVKNSLH